MKKQKPTKLQRAKHSSRRPLPPVVRSELTPTSAPLPPDAWRDLLDRLNTQITTANQVVIVSADWYHRTIQWLLGRGPQPEEPSASP